MKVLYLVVAAAVLGLAAWGCSMDVSVDVSVSEEGADGASAVEEDGSAPGFEVEVFGNENYAEGESVGLDAFAGMPVVLNFWYPSCPPCRLEMPHFEAAFQTYKDRVAFVGIQQLGLDSASDGQEFVDEFGLTYAIGADRTGTVIREYQVVSFPTTVFLDGNHAVVRKWAGPLDEEKLGELIEELLSAS